MGSFIKETVGKIAGNVTQSVASAIVVTLISTYLLVDLGKKDKGTNPSAADSAKSNTTAVPMQMSEPRGETGPSLQQLIDTAGKTVNAGGSAKGLPVRAADGKANQVKTESPGVQADPKELKELLPGNPTEKKLEPTITQARAKGDSLVKGNAHDTKVKDVKKEVKKEVKDVHQRADEVFDELDKEVEEKPQP